MFKTCLPMGQIMGNRVLVAGRYSTTVVPWVAGSIPVSGPPPDRGKTLVAVMALSPVVGEGASSGWDIGLDENTTNRLPCLCHQLHFAC